MRTNTLTNAIDFLARNVAVCTGRLAAALGASAAFVISASPPAKVGRRPRGVNNLSILLLSKVSIFGLFLGGVSGCFPHGGGNAFTTNILIPSMESVAKNVGTSTNTGTPRSPNPSPAPTPTPPTPTPTPNTHARTHAQRIHAPLRHQFCGGGKRHRRWRGEQQSRHLFP